MQNVYFKGSETAGSVAKITQPQVKRYEKPAEQTPPVDTVSFRGKDDTSESIGKTAVGILAAAALIVGGLGYAKKADWVGKIKNAKVKDFADKITEPCYNLCHKTKEFALKYYNKAKDFFSKKS